MKITYIYPPLFKNFYPMATRMITENLLRNRNLDVDFSDIPVKTYSSKIHKKLYDDFMSKGSSIFSPNTSLFLQQKYMINNIFYVFMTHGYYNEFIYDHVESDYVVFTCINFCDLLIVKHLLNDNKKVVLGGPLVTIGLSAKFIRQFLHLMGTKQDKLMNDLIVVTGNIDLSTDMYQIIKNWKDSTIIHNDYGSLFECERDFLQTYYGGSSKIPVHFGFNNRCWYGKCKFCTYKGLPNIDFLSGVEETKVVNYLHKMMNKFNSSEMRFIDSYFHTDSPRIHNIFSQINEYNITIYSGILLLKNRAYIDLINKYANVLLIGLESTSEFSLKQVDKGYGYEAIKLAMDNVIKYLDKNIFLEISIILDLPSKDEEDVKRNYRNILEIQQRLSQEGFRVGVHMNILSVFPNLELLYGPKNLLQRSNDLPDIERSTGKNYIINFFRKAGMDEPLLLPSDLVLVDEECVKDLHYGYISSDVPIIRKDVNGNLLPSDLELIDEEVMRRILTSRKKRG